MTFSGILESAVLRYEIEWRDLLYCPLGSLKERRQEPYTYGNITFRCKDLLTRSIAKHGHSPLHEASSALGPHPFVRHHHLMVEHPAVCSMVHHAAAPWQFHRCPGLSPGSGKYTVLQHLLLLDPDSTSGCVTLSELYSRNQVRESE